MNKPSKNISTVNETQEKKSLDLYETFNKKLLDGYSIETDGRFLFVEPQRNLEEHHKILEEIVNSKVEFLAEIEEDIKNLELLLKRIHPFELIGHISLRNSIFFNENYKEYESDKNAAFVEYISLLCLNKQYSYFCISGSNNELPFMIDEIQSFVKNLFHKYIFYLKMKDLDLESKEEKNEKILSKIRDDTLSNSVGVRFPSYQHHLKDILLGVFFPLNKDLEKTFGFNINDAIRISDSIIYLFSKRFLDVGKEATEFTTKLGKAVKRLRQKKNILKDSQEIPFELIKNLANQKPSESARYIESMKTDILFSNLLNILQFTSEEIQEETGLSFKIINSFLERFSITFGEIEDRYRFPSPTHPLMNKFLIRKDKFFLCPVFQRAYWSLRYELETSLNPDVKEVTTKDQHLWEKYEESRSEYLETKGLEYLSSLLKRASCYKNLCYQVEEDGNIIDVELDGLLILDKHLFLVEAKAGTISPPARRGGKKRILKELEDNVQYAFIQSSRAKKYIQNNEIPIFFLKDKSTIKIKKEEYEQIFLITITLDELDTFVTNLYHLRELDYFKENEFPWVVSLANLRVISEILEYPCQFVHYLQRRNLLNTEGFVEAHDEIDWFGHYLQEGLFFSNLKNSETPFKINLSTYTTEIDEYYLKKIEKEEKNVEKPKQPMPEILNQLLAELEQKHLAGYLKASCVLLDSDTDARNLFSNNFITLKKKTLIERKPHNFTLGVDKYGITYLFLPMEKEYELEYVLTEYCIKKKHEMKFDFWLGFGCIVDRNEKISYFRIY